VYPAIHGDLFGSALSIEQYIQSVQHLLDKTGNNKLSLLPGHTGENRSPLTDQYIGEMMACAKGLVDGSITGTPFCRTFSGMLTLGNIATIGQASVIYNLNNIHTIKGALRNLTISQGNLNPRFAPYTAYYVASVSAEIKTITISPTVLAKGFDHVTINGHVLDNANAYEANLTSGENRFSIEVTSFDKVAKIYTLTITRAKQ
jgi:hypothetical protein